MIIRIVNFLRLALLFRLLGKLRQACNPFKVFAFTRRLRKGLVSLPYPLAFFLIHIGLSAKWTSWTEAYLWSLEELAEVREKGPLTTDQLHRANELLDVLNCIAAMVTLHAPSDVIQRVVSEVPLDIKPDDLRMVYPSWRIALVRRLRIPSDCDVLISIINN